jgi:hypothetical protein
MTLPQSLRSIVFKSLATPGLQWPNAFPPSLESLIVIDAMPIIGTYPATAFANCPNLKYLEIDGFLNDTLWQFPSLGTTQIESLILAYIDLNVDQKPLADLLRSAPSAKLKHVSLEGSTIERLPDCISQYTHLQTLNLAAIKIGNKPNLLVNVTAPNLSTLRLHTKAWEPQMPDCSDIASRFPRLEILSVVRTSTQDQSPFPAAQLMSLSNLAELTLTSLPLTGTLPSNFFTTLTKLQRVEIIARLTGTIPVAGWTQLKLLNLRQNSFSDFAQNGWTGAPNLERLDVSFNFPLRSIPSDEIFSTMPKLDILRLNNCPNLAVQLPRFWASASSVVSQFTSTSSPLVGPLPSLIENQRLRTLSMSNNSICGPLPELGRPISLLSINLQQNRIQGTIPASWGSKLKIMASLSVATNFLEGTIPNPIVAPQSGYFLDSIKLGGNYLSGPLFNVSGYLRLYELNLAGPNMTLDACSQDPSFPEAAGASCQLDTRFGCECPTFYSACSGHEAACLVPYADDSTPEEQAHSGQPVIPPIFDCPIPSLPPVSCPLPAPGPSFQCINQAWVSGASVSVPSLTIPSDSVVVIGGNLSIGGGALELSGIDVTLQVEGCFFLEGEGGVLITLTQEDLDQLEKKN